MKITRRVSKRERIDMAGSDELNRLVTLLKNSGFELFLSARSKDAAIVYFSEHHRADGIDILHELIAEAESLME